MLTTHPPAITPTHPRARRTLRGRRAVRAVVALAVALPLGATATVPAPALAQVTSAASSCGIVWGSQPKAAGTLSPAAQVSGVRSGEHACWDRLVVDLAGPLKGYDVRYVPVVRAEGSGMPVPVRGGAAIAVVIKAPSYDPATGRPTFVPSNPREVVRVTGDRTFRQIAWAGSFEGQTTLALGVRARLPFRAFILAGPGTGSRLVVDVAHTW